MHIEPAIDADTLGRFAITWMTWMDGSYAVSYRTFDADGEPLTEPLVAAADDAWHSGANVAVGPDGRFLLSWTVDDPDTAWLGDVSAPSRADPPAEIHARYYSLDGAPLDDVFRANQFNEGRQALSIAASGRQLVWTDRDQLAIVWKGRTGSDEKHGIGLTLLTPRKLSAPAPVDVTPITADQNRAGALAPAAPSPPVYDPDAVPSARVASPDPAGPDYGFLGIQATGYYPPDPDIGAGPDYVVLVVNGEIRFRAYNSLSTFNSSLGGAEGFFADQVLYDSVFDPVALYDTLSDRYIVLAGELSEDHTLSAINLAVSDDDNPNGDWYKYRFDVTEFGGFYDYPNLGVDENAIYVCGDYFIDPVGNWAFIIDKGPTLTGDPTTIAGLETYPAFNSLGNTKHYDNGRPRALLRDGFLRRQSRHRAEGYHRPPRHADAARVQPHRSLF